MCHGLSCNSRGEELMPKRVTIMIDDDIHEKLRIIQANLIREFQTSMSFSRVINAQLRKSLK